MINGQPVELLGILRRCLSRLARHSAHFFFGFLSSLHCAAGHLRLGASLSDKRFVTCFFRVSGVLPQSQGYIAGNDVPVCSSRPSPGHTRLELAGASPPLRRSLYKTPFITFKFANGYGNIAIGNQYDNDSIYKCHGNRRASSGFHVKLTHICADGKALW